MDPATFAEKVMRFCIQLDGSVSSWGRTPAHNHKVGGVAGSPHTHWVGADVVYDKPVSEASRRSLADILGLMVVVEGDHDHLQPKGWVNKV